ncbi:hypothetical protein Tco_0316750 [Tanacetum coccineum]
MSTVTIKEVTFLSSDPEKAQEALAGPRPRSYKIRPTRSDSGDKEQKIALSISKLKVARYLDFGLEELVSSLWVESEREYDISAIVDANSQCDQSDYYIKEDYKRLSQAKSRCPTETENDQRKLIEARMTTQFSEDVDEDTYPILLSFTHCGNKSILRVLRIILVILPEHPSETIVFHNEDGNPARANIKQALGYLKDGDGDGNSQPHKGVKASANSDIMYFFTSAQDGDPLQDDVRLCLGDDLKKAQDHSQRQIKRGPTLKVNEICKVPLAIGKHYNELVTCDVVDIEACHVLLGRPWQHDMDTKLENKTLVTFVASPKEFQDERIETGFSYALVVKGVEDVMENAIPTVVKPLLDEFGKTVADDTSNTLPPLRNIQHQIDMVPEASLPNLPHYKMSPKEFEILTSG